MCDRSKKTLVTQLAAAHQGCYQWRGSLASCCHDSHGASGGVAVSLNKQLATLGGGHTQMIDGGCYRCVLSQQAVLTTSG
jgi:hypothetical protein